MKQMASGLNGFVNNAKNTAGRAFQRVSTHFRTRYDTKDKVKNLGASLALLVGTTTGIATFAKYISKAPPRDSSDGGNGGNGTNPNMDSNTERTLKHIHQYHEGWADLCTAMYRFKPFAPASYDALLLHILEVLRFHKKIKNAAVYKYVVLYRFTKFVTTAQEFISILRARVQLKLRCRDDCDVLRDFDEIAEEMQTLFDADKFNMAMELDA